MGFLDIGNKKHQGQHRQEHLLESSAALKRRRLRYFSLVDRLPPDFWLAFRRNAYLAWRAARGTDLNSSSRDIELNLSETCHHQEQHELLSGICPFFYEKFG